MKDSGKGSEFIELYKHLSDESKAKVYIFLLGMQLVQLLVSQEARPA